jgi:uncharacterized repeat protein (TIGR02543 family)
VSSGFNGTYEEWLSSIRGENGRAIELRIEGDMIQWRYSGDIFWYDLMSLSKIQGLQGEHGKNGIDGLVPYVGSNGTWWIGDLDTGVKATQESLDGLEGGHGQVPYIGTNGHWWIGSIDTGIRARGVDGLSAFELFKQAHPTFTGSEFDWITQLIHGANWKTYHTVTFNTMGGNVIAPQVVEEGKKIVRPEDPVKQGHRFEGWFVGNERWVFIGFAVTETLELSARWSPKTYPITYQLNGGMNHPQNPNHITYGVPLLLEDPTKVGHDFIGWFINNELTDVFDQTTIIDRPITLYAKWSASTYLITYNLDGGVNHPSNPQSYVYGTTLSFFAPSRADYSFSGWFLNDSFTSPIQGITSSTFGAVTVYAKWTSTSIIPVTGISFPNTLLGFTSTGVYQLVATVSPSDATNKTLTWSSNNSAAISVNSSGLITVTSRGTALITATADNGISTNVRISYYYAYNSYVLNEVEPNGSISLADPMLTNGTTIRGYNSSKSDGDYFAVILTESFSYRLSLFPDYSIDTDYFLVGLLDSGGNVIKAGIKVSSSERLLEYSVPTSGIYYIVVLYSSSSPYSSGMGYRAYSRWI